MTYPTATSKTARSSTAYRRAHSIRPTCHRTRGHRHSAPVRRAGSAQAWSRRFYDAAGTTFDYEYELVDDNLTIWTGTKGSPAFSQST